MQERLLICVLLSCWQEISITNSWLNDVRSTTKHVYHSKVCIGQVEANPFPLFYCTDVLFTVFICRFSCHQMVSNFHSPSLHYCSWDFQDTWCKLFAKYQGVCFSHVIHVLQTSQNGFLKKKEAIFETGTITDLSGPSSSQQCWALCWMVRVCQ